MRSHNNSLQTPTSRPDSSFLRGFSSCPCSVMGVEWSRPHRAYPIHHLWLKNTCVGGVSRCGRPPVPSPAVNPRECRLGIPYTDTAVKRCFGLFRMARPPRDFVALGPLATSTASPAPSDRATFAMTRGAPDPLASLAWHPAVAGTGHVLCPAQHLDVMASTRRTWLRFPSCTLGEKKGPPVRLDFNRIAQLWARRGGGGLGRGERSVIPCRNGCWTRPSPSSTVPTLVYSRGRVESQPGRYPSLGGPVLGCRFLTLEVRVSPPLACLEPGAEAEGSSQDGPACCLRRIRVLLREASGFCARVDGS